MAMAKHVNLHHMVNTLTSTSLFMGLALVCWRVINDENLCVTVDDCERT